MNFAEALAELEGRGEGRMVPNLDRIHALAELMNHPERTYPSVHVTGTNGKTTTARLVGRILCAHGLAAGVYTSPHLSSVTERLGLCDDEITEAEFAETYEHLLPYLRTVDEVAKEKAGIIKPGATVVVGDPSPVTLSVVETRAAELGSPTVVRGRDYLIDGPTPAVGGQQITVRTKAGEYADLFLPLFGAHQAENAAAAIVACEAFLGRELSHDMLRAALSGVASPGRLEVVSRHPLVVLDGAHNPNAAIALAAALPEAFVWKGLHLVVGVLETKDVAGILAPLASRTSVAYACANSNPKSLDPERLAAACEAVGMTVDAFPTVAHALDAAESDAEDEDIILVTGSLYTVADARPRYVED